MPVRPWRNSVLSCLAASYIHDTMCRGGVLPMAKSEAQHEGSVHLSFTEEQGSMISSFAAILASTPSVTLLRYTMGVLPVGNGKQNRFGNFMSLP